MLKTQAATRLRASVAKDCVEEFACLVRCLDSVKWQKLEDCCYFDTMDECCVHFRRDSFKALIKRLEGEGYRHVSSAPVPEVECLRGCTHFCIMGYGSGKRCPIVAACSPECAYLYMPTFTTSMAEFLSCLEHS